MIEARLFSSLDEIAPPVWDALAGDDNPFVSHTFLSGLEQHRCLRSDYGWQAQHIGLYDDDQLIAAVPSYLKGNSHGEFVFDWSWAGAYERNGLDYYPKLLCAVPYSPVPGPRLLAGTGPLASSRRVAMRDALVQVVKELDLSSVHLNFCSDDDAAAFDGSDWLPRFDWQFHWHQRGYRDFADFLDALLPKKRKNIRQEREQVARAGVRCEVQHGDELSESDWRFVHRCYRSTFEEKGNHPALTLPFFKHLGATLGRGVVAMIARRGDEPIAAALCLRSATTLYGRYWGALEHVPGLHFEACYYQGIEYCLRHGLQRFEPGAQGEHKLARGFMPVRTRSFHWLADARFRHAVRDALEREALVLAEYHADLLRHSPYAITL
jgi:predicted N-acyltransferase